MTEYGIFNEEGLIEGGFYDKEAALQYVSDICIDEPSAYVEEICVDHPEQPAGSCQDCLEDEDDG